MASDNELKDDAVVDVHAHVLDADDEIVPMPFFPQVGRTYRAAVEAELAKYEADNPLNRRLAALDAAGIDLQVLSMLQHKVPGHVPDAAFCSMFNSKIADFVDQAPTRLRAFAMLDMSDIPGAVKELNRAVGLGHLGAYLTPTFELDDPALDDFYETLVGLDVPLFIHGNMPGWSGSKFCDPRLFDRSDPDVLRGGPAGKYKLGPSWIFLYEETLAALSLVMGGVLDRHPTLDVCIGHGGGALALLVPRMIASLGPIPQESVPSPAHLRGLFDRLWVDCDVLDPRSLQFLLDMLNADRVVLGTDYPGWDVHPLHNLAPADRDRLSRNARALLRL